MDSLALRCAKFERELLLSRATLSGIKVVLKEEDAQADPSRIVVTAKRGSQEMAGATTSVGIYNVQIMVELKIQDQAGNAYLVDHYLREIDEANKGVPSVPSPGYAAAAAALSVFILKDDDETEQEDTDDIRNATRTFNVLAKES